jgi:4-hydroxythreonine-4-phosphate dehydrogenase
VIDVPLAAHVVPGTLDARNGRAVLATLDLAIEGVQAGWFDAIVTAPLQKSTINEAGVAFSGHTEYLAEKTGTPKVVMMLAGQPAGDQPYLRVALATTHLPLKDVPARSRKRAWRRCSTSCTPTCAANSASPRRASWSPA